MARTKPQFLKEPEDGFYRDLRSSIQPLLDTNDKRATSISWIKTIAYPSTYVFVYLLLLWKGYSLFWFFSCYALLGAITTFIVFNIVHDAIHHALFKRQLFNKRSALLLDMLGGNSFVWGKRHVLYHHTFTNIPGWDIDIQQTKLLRFNEKQEYLPAYRYQHIYMPFLYLFYSLNWILVRDFKDFFSKKSLIKQKVKIERLEFIKLFVFKTVYIFLILVIPILVLHHYWYLYFIAFILMHWVTSAFTLLVLLPSHLDEEANFPEPNADLILEDTWAVHQLKVTNDFSTNQPIFNFLMGGLNHHIAHHLFPTVNHNIIPRITKHIEKAAKERNLPYKCYSLGAVMVSHFKLLKKRSRQINFFEE